MTLDDLLYYLPDEILSLLTKCAITPQNPEWHPEAPNAKVPHNVLSHIQLVCDRAAKTEDINFLLAGLFHDLGKVEATTKNNKGNWSAYGHEFVSAKLVIRHEDWIERLGGNSKMIYEIVKEHMRAKSLNEMRESKRQEFQLNCYHNEILEFTKFDDMSNLTQEELHRYD